MVGNSLESIEGVVAGDGEDKKERNGKGLVDIAIASKKEDVDDPKEDSAIPQLTHVGGTGTNLWGGKHHPLGAMDDQQRA